MITKYRASEGSLTVVIVAFRIITFKTMDKIVILQKGGGVGAVGTHEEILEDHPDSAYAKYCKQQETSEAARLNVAVQIDDI